MLGLLPEPADEVPCPVKKGDDFDFGLSDFIDEAIRMHEDFADGGILELGNHTTAFAKRLE
jgi:hypothetical protein